MREREDRPEEREQGSVSWSGAVLLGILAACAPALGDLLDGGEGDMEFEDEDNGLTAEFEEQDCESDGDAVECEYDVTLEGDGDSEAYTVVLRYESDGSITAVGGADAYGQELLDDVVVIPGGLAEGDEEDASYNGDDYTIGLDGVGDTVDDANGDEWGGCDVYEYSFDGDGSMEVSICDGIGLMRIEAEGYDFRRKP